MCAGVCMGEWELWKSTVDLTIVSSVESFSRLSLYFPMFSHAQIREENQSRTRLSIGTTSRGPGLYFVQKL